MNDASSIPLQINLPLKIVIVGHVDHGKSSLIGRLFHDTGSLPEGKAETIRTMCERRGMPFEWAFLMDALKAERDQGITIDVSHIHFRTIHREYVLIDAPGHREFIKNMVTGAAQADAAILVVDARDGVQEQTRRHAYLLHLLGIRQVIVAINKMDLVEFSEARFQTVAADVREYLAGLGIDLQHTQIIPVSAREGDNVVGLSAHMGWYEGDSLAQALDGFQPPLAPLDLPLRFPIQDVYKFDERRILAGRIESGHLRRGDVLLFSPSNKTARVSSIEAWNADEPVLAVRAGQSVGVTLDEQLFVERGDSVERNAVAEVVFRSRRQVALDPFENNMSTGRFVLVEDYDIVGGGLISMDGYADQRAGQTIRATNIFRVEHRVPEEERWRHNGHRGGVLWMTGLSGAGKSTLAFSLEQYLFRKGYQVYVLDGDNIRHGLCSDLGFSPEDRVENIRRVGHAAGLFARAGFLVITAFISPYRSDRDRVRALAPEIFHEVHVDADLRTCEERDPKGLYAKARRGEIDDFTGVSAPYEPPVMAELRIDTTNHSVEDSVAILSDYIAKNFAITPH
jgi:bifunctional enzyme CysN/CysC